MLGLVLLPAQLLLIGFLVPQSTKIPVLGANSGDWHPDSFWHYPWGRSGTHKGIDIFAKRGTPVVSATDGYVFARYNGKISGKSLLVLGPKWRVHYYAHLNDYSAKPGDFVRSGTHIASVGNTGNA